MEYNEAVDVFAGPPPIKTLAEALGISENTLSQTRLTSDARRPPPKGWRSVLCRLVDARIEELTALRRMLADA